VRTLIILVLVGLILGGSAYFTYELYWKPRKLDQRMACRGAQAIPDYVAGLSKAADLEQAANIETRAAWEKLSRDYPNAQSSG
jgi:hypothetical protein